MFIYLDGEITNEGNLKINFLDNCGVFETLRAYNKKIFKLKEHLTRIYQSAKSLNLKIPLKSAKLEDAILKTLFLSKLNNAYLRVSFNYSLNNSSKPVFLIFVKEIKPESEELYKKGVEVKTVSLRKNFSGITSLVKSSDFSCNVLAKIESARCENFEAIQLTSSGYVSEGTVSNIFIVKKNILWTPPISCNVLSGITRRTVIDLAKKYKLSVDENFLTLYDIYNAEEVFLTNTTLEIMPVSKIDGRIISEGIGKITKFLFEEFRKMTRR